MHTQYSNPISIKTTKGITSKHTHAHTQKYKISEEKMCSLLKTAEECQPYVNLASLQEKVLAKHLATAFMLQIMC